MRSFDIPERAFEIIFWIIIWVLRGRAERKKKLKQENESFKVWPVEPPKGV